MTDYYLKAASLEAILAALAFAGINVVEEDGQLRSTDPVCVLDFIGPIEGAVGYHANMRARNELDATSLMSVLIPTPEYPKYVWA